MSKSFLKNKTIIFIIAFLLLVLGVYYTMAENTTNENTMSENSSQGKKVLLETNQGIIMIELYSDMPITTGNFEKLVSEGFYNGVIFHRIIPGFMIQGGDPQGTGVGGPGYNIQDEFTHAGGNKNNRLTISMANSGPNTGGSQFFINLVDNNFLDEKHPAFGEVVEGKDIVEAIGNAQTGQNDRPLEEIKIIKASIV